MRLLPARLAAIEALSKDLKQQGRRALKSDVSTLRELIADENESLQKSSRTASNPAANETYRRNMAKAVENSKATISLLDKALQAVKDRQLPAACQYLDEVLLLRGKKATQSRSGLGRLYAEFQMQRDTAFHDWLREFGHTEALQELGVPVAKPKTRGRRVDLDGRSNRPEDYE